MLERWCVMIVRLEVIVVIFVIGINRLGYVLVSDVIIIVFIVWWNFVISY